MGGGRGVGHNRQLRRMQGGKVTLYCNFYEYKLLYTKNTTLLFQETLPKPKVSIVYQDSLNFIYKLKDMYMYQYIFKKQQLSASHKYIGYTLEMYPISSSRIIWFRYNGNGVTGISFGGIFGIRIIRNGKVQFIR